jgi:hypothetical protein
MRVPAMWAALAACGRIHFDATGDGGGGGDGTQMGSQSQTLTVASAGDDGTIDNFTIYPAGESGVDYPGFSASSTQPSFGYYRFQVTAPIPAGATLTANTRLRLWGADGSFTGANTFEFNSVDAELAASTTAPTAATEVPLGLGLFIDALGSGWFFQGSSPTTSAVESTLVASGANALAITIDVNAGWFNLQSAYHTVAISDFANISFDINAGAGAGPSLDAMAICSIGLTTGVAVSSYVPGGHLAANTWYHVQIPFAAFYADGSKHLEFLDTTNDQLSFYLDNIQLEGPSATYRVVTSAAAIWPNSGATAYAASAWNTSPSLAPVLQELVDTYGGLAAGSYITLWVQGPRLGFGYTGTATYQPGYADYDTDPAHAAQLTLEY